jgi:ribosomal protein L19E
LRACIAFVPLITLRADKADSCGVLKTTVISERQDTRAGQGRFKGDTTRACSTIYTIVTSRALRALDALNTLLTFVTFITLRADDVDGLRIL